MIDLRDELIFSKILPKGYIRIEMVLVVEPVAADPGIGIAGVAPGNASHKEARHEDEGHEQMDHP